MNTASAWRTALDVVARLIDDPRVIGVAATGSLARGDFAPGSDVDLWVVSADNLREELDAGGLHVSLLHTTERFARSLEGLLRFEVDAAVILHDPEGRLLALKDLATERASVVDAAMREGASETLSRLAHLVESTDDPHLALAALRELARRAAALFVYDARGWRVPRERHLKRSLPPGAFARLAEFSAPPADLERFPALVQSARGQPSPVRDMPLPEARQVQRYIAAARVLDVTGCIRQALPPGPWAEGLASMNEPQRALFDAIHGFDAATSPTAREVGRAAREAMDLLHDLALDRDPRLRSTVWGALARVAERRSFG